MRVTILWVLERDGQDEVHHFEVSGHPSAIGSLATTLANVDESQGIVHILIIRDENGIYRNWDGLVPYINLQDWIDSLYRKYTVGRNI